MLLSFHNTEEEKTVKNCENSVMKSGSEIEIITRHLVHIKQEL